MQIIHDRRRLHALAELGSHLPQTLAYLRGCLSPLKCRVWEAAPGSLCAWFDFGQRDCIGFRADTDGLPIQEKNGLPWQSVHPGCMHACGHDGHTAMLLELARRLNRRKALFCNVLLIFQCAEETVGGALPICRTGILEDLSCRAIFALHLWPGLPLGQFFSRPGCLMSQSCGVTAEFFGRSAHIAQPHRGRDALSACCRFYRFLDPPRQAPPGTVRFGTLWGGTAGNIICGQGRMTGSIRAFSQAQLIAWQQWLMERMLRVSRQTGCTGRLTFHPGYPALENDRALFDRVRQQVPLRLLQAPLPAAEDHAFYGQRIPSLYTLLGVGNTPPLHSPCFTFNEAVLPLGVRYYEDILAALQPKAEEDGLCEK